jgi:hypothetical protein
LVFATFAPPGNGGLRPWRESEISSGCLEETGNILVERV